ncbi:hypothetical protein [Oceanirhabdus seepicola]|uniref:Uncharacterized protein n=1 Tax=Oceanirhabdus seepicola TaxID=2828781 RepID=A0A9J6NZ69_9CLOT|nr:hypothetical protein [Oceanirhabdus seepicola]MCM1989270.1 hypothetical protein [Oceanirhabdus seepicola]
MTKIRTIILHVGLHKTATSSIQRTLFLDANNRILAESGFIYLKVWSDNHSVPVYSMFCDNPENYHMNIKMGYSKEKIKNVNENYSKKLMKEIANKKWSNLIISGEDISKLNKNNLINLREYLNSICNDRVNIRVVVYVRNPVLWAISDAQQSVRSELATLQEAIESHKKLLKNLFRVRIGNLIQVFGKETLEVYSFEKATAHKFGPVGHFLSVIGFNNKEIRKIKIIRANQSMSQTITNLISYINEKAPLIKDGKINKERFYCDARPLVKVRGSKFDISYKDKKELLESAMEDIKWLKDNVGIDYSDIKVQNSEIFKEALTEETIRDIKNVFHERSSFIKRCIVEYFENQLKENKDNVDRELIEGMLEGMLYETLYEKEYNVVDIERFPIIYKLKNKPINISKDIIEIEKKTDGWFIESSGIDPYFTLPQFDGSKNKGTILVKMEITSTVKTKLQLYYKSDKIYFTERDSIRREIDKGYNELIIVINESKPVKALRLDPGKDKGIYLLHEFDVRVPKKLNVRDEEI